jgi:hypothetical protein
MDAVANMDGPASKAVMSAYLITSTTMAGAMLMQTRDLLTGKDPRAMLDKDWYKFWGQAFLQGGALGIYGDFLYGINQTRYGSGPIEALAGPTIGPLLELGLVPAAQRREESHRGQGHAPRRADDPGPEGLRAGRQHLVHEGRGRPPGVAARDGGADPGLPRQRPPKDDEGVRPGLVVAPGRRDTRSRAGLLQGDREMSLMASVMEAPTPSRPTMNQTSGSSRNASGTSFPAASMVSAAATLSAMKKARTAAAWKKLLTGAKDTPSVWDDTPPAYLQCRRRRGGMGDRRGSD